MSSDDPDDVELLAVAVARLNVPDQDRLIAILKRMPNFVALKPIRHRRLMQQTERNRMIVAFRVAFHGNASANAAAKEVGRAFAVYRSGEWRHHRYLVSPPSNLDLRRRTLFELFQFADGDLPGPAMLRKIFNEGPDQATG